MDIVRNALALVAVSAGVVGAYYWARMAVEAYRRRQAAIITARLDEVEQAATRADHDRRSRATGRHHTPALRYTSTDGGQR